MNSKPLQEKVQQTDADDGDGIEMRLLRRSEKNHETAEEKEKAICTSRSTVSLKHYDQLICDLRCPGCATLLQAPIYLCMSGHSLCRLCRVSAKKCPVCESDLSNIRSYTLERLTGKFQFPCNNLRNGCSVRLPLELMKWHEEKCIYKKTSCFMGKIWHDCDWRGRENEWLQHCRQKHSQKILQKQECFELIWNFETLKNNSGPIVAYYLIQNYGETFNLYQIHEAKHATMTWTIILANYVTSSKNDEQKSDELPKFSFEFEFYNRKDPRFLNIQRYPVHYEDSEEVLDDGRCVRVSLNDVQKFLDQDQNLFYRVKILASKDRKDRWDELLEKTIHRSDGFSVNDEFAFFDEGRDDQVFMDDEKLVVLTENRQRQRRDDDMLKKIFEKEFSPSYHHNELTRPIQKPPRKSLESLNSKKTASSYSSRNSMRFDD